MEALFPLATYPELEEFKQTALIEKRSSNENKYYEPFSVTIIIDWGRLNYYLTYFVVDRVNYVYRS